MPSGAVSIDPLARCVLDVYVRPPWPCGAVHDRPQTLQLPLVPSLRRDAVAAQGGSSWLNDPSWTAEGKRMSLCVSVGTPQYRP